jgi:hypothetical protein
LKKLSPIGQSLKSPKDLPQPFIIKFRTIQDSSKKIVAGRREESMFIWKIKFVSLITMLESVGG